MIRPGEVQVMSAGSGVRHSEYNNSASEPVHFLQIWLMPDEDGLPPRYDQKAFAAAEKAGRLRLVVSPDGRDGSLSVRVDAELYATRLEAGESVTHALKPGRLAWAQIVAGGATVNGAAVSAGDGVAIEAADAVTIAADAGRSGAAAVRYAGVTTAPARAATARGKRLAAPLRFVRPSIRRPINARKGPSSPHDVPERVALTGIASGVPSTALRAVKAPPTRAGEGDAIAADRRCSGPATRRSAQDGVESGKPLRRSRPPKSKPPPAPTTLDRASPAQPDVGLSSIKLRRKSWRMQAGCSRKRQNAIASRRCASGPNASPESGCVSVSVTLSWTHKPNGCAAVA